MTFELRWEDDEIEKWMESWQEPAVKKTLRAAASAFGRAGKPILRAATPSARPGNPYAVSAGNLQRVTRYKRIRARYGIGVVIAAMGKTAYYRQMVTGGTKPHLILPKKIGGKLAVLGGVVSAVHHPGAKPNPYVARASGAVNSAGFAAAEKVIFAGLEDSRRVIETED